MPMPETGGMLPAGSVSNLLRDHLVDEIGCHGGIGSVAAFRAYRRAGAGALVDFIDLVVVPPGASIGRHRHGDNVEWYVVLAGSGAMWFDGQIRMVGAGDILVNPPYGEHGLENRSAQPLHLLVFQLSHDITPKEH